MAIYLKRTFKMFASKLHPCTWMASLRFSYYLIVLVATSYSQPSARFTQSMYTFDVLEEQLIGTTVDSVEVLSQFGFP